MSVILDALKKAEHDRGLARVPTLTSVHVEGPENRRRMLPWVMASALFVSGAAGLWAWPVLSARVGGLVSDFGGNGVSVSNPEARQPSIPPHSPQPVERSVSIPSPPEKAAPVESPPPPPQATTVPKPPPALPVTPLKKTSVTPAQPPTLKAAPAEAYVPAYIPPEAEVGRPNAVLAPSPTPSVPAAIEARVNPAPIPPQPSTAPQRESSPSRLQEAIARMTVNVLVYAEEPSDRKVYIGGRGYVEGELVEGAFLVEEIRPEGAALSYQGQRGLLRKR
jgi:hypothetical protein